MHFYLTQMHVPTFISFVSLSQLLQENQPYGVVVHLEIPETPRNVDMGMFMIRMLVNGRDDRSEKVKDWFGDDDDDDHREKNSWFYGKQKKNNVASRLQASRPVGFESWFLILPC